MVTEISVDYEKKKNVALKQFLFFPPVALN